MGFLKFLKREKKSDLDELDLPPAPPSLEGFEENEMQDFPEFPEEKISAPKEQKFGFGREEMPLENEMLEMPELPEMEERPVAMQPKAPVPSMPPISAPAHQAPQPAKEEIVPEEPRFTPLGAYPKMERRLFSQEKKILRERPSGKTIYVKVEKFKAALGSISLVRSDLRKSEDALGKLESIKSSKDKSFDKVMASLDDLQKKLIFIDKTLFKED